MPTAAQKFDPPAKFPPTINPETATAEPAQIVASSPYVWFCSTGLLIC